MREQTDADNGEQQRSVPINVGGYTLRPVPPPKERRRVFVINMTWSLGRLFVLTLGSKPGEIISVEMHNTWYTKPVAQVRGEANFLGFSFLSLKVPDFKIGTGWPVTLTVLGQIHEGAWKTAPNEFVRIDTKSARNRRPGNPKETPWA